MGEGRGVDTVYLDFRVRFSTPSPIRLIDKLLMYELNEQTARWIERLGPESGDQWHKILLEASNYCCIHRVSAGSSTVQQLYS